MLCDAQVTGSLSLVLAGAGHLPSAAWGQGERGEEASAVPLGEGPDAGDSAGPTLHPSCPRASMHPSLGGAPWGSSGD